ncbi:hypothetical protein HanRHA438_Chr09g0384471 [Helianthus annuus]|uniref:Uncharacterized protein n=1 Tax=Helianthus annuus TaxID=4232 RepID=A0A9K3N7T9_HELAN|nr:hypothetical protein HanXRQr2_Chr09g0372561 [Helianthus annuus]KAJ0511985.1 hypothetical protein HanIR_Chr11g0558161 [Helianthus annuus]KAJ0532881.1 hypothetical protein HanIR_Chr09g0401941 [Helianthus annuus]KAJ0886886.1 hypothetical protein HanRHA438_Chr09g0384471 [Helianthus annuus]KAJ0891857.1 hypothetical protein HanPSC8_Chr09g0359071 [Helianthus annuus]
MALTTRNLADQLATIATKLDAILASLRDVVDDIKAQMIGDGCNIEESGSDLKNTVEKGIKETATDEGLDGLKEELQAHVHIQEPQIVSNAASIALKYESKNDPSKPTRSLTWRPSPKPISAYAKNTAQFITQNPTPQRQSPRTTETENQTRFLKRQAAGHRCKTGTFNLLETTEGQDEPLNTNKEPKEMEDAESAIKNDVSVDAGDIFFIKIQQYHQKSLAKLDPQPSTVLAYCSVLNAGHPILELLRYWGNRPLEEKTWKNYDCLEEQFPVFRLEDKSCLRAGCIDTNLRSTHFSWAGPDGYSTHLIISRN